MFNKLFFPVFISMGIGIVVYLTRDSIFKPFKDPKGSVMLRSRLPHPPRLPPRPEPGKDWTGS